MSAPGLLALLAERDVHLSIDADGRLELDMPTAAPLDAEELGFLRAHRIEIIAGLIAEPVDHCVCGSPSWWRSPSSPTWTCSYCAPRPRSVTEAVESVVIDSGHWRAGTRPPAAIPTTRTDLIALYGETVAECALVDVLELADDDDLPELRDADVLEGFAVALVADRRIRPLPPLNPAAPREPRRPEDGRVQGAGGAWRTPVEREAHTAFDRHHWTCPTCQRGGRGYTACVARLARRCTPPAARRYAENRHHEAVDAPPPRACRRARVRSRIPARQHGAPARNPRRGSPRARSGAP